MVDTPPMAPEAEQALYVQGLTALRDGDLAMAVPLLDQAVCLQPANINRRRNLVRALLAAERFAAVVEHCRIGLAAVPRDAEWHFALGSALSGVGRPAEARAVLAQALALRPEHAPSWLNLANACADLDDPAMAEAFCRKAIGFDPALVEAHASLSVILARQGRLSEAVAAADAAIRRQPAYAQAHWNRANALLLSGDLPNGFAAYEWRKRHKAFAADFPALPGPEWDGGDPRGKTILVRAEQGFGDAIQFARYLPLLRAAGGKPLLLCAPPLLRLMNGLHGIQAVDRCSALPAYDAWIDQATLPLRYRTSVSDIPLADRYLRADPVLVRGWRERLPTGRKIGVAFAGNRRHAGDRHRSIPPAAMAPLLSEPETVFVNLQHGAEAAAVGLPDLTEWMSDYAETAALIETLDLVITVDTSVAHLAGALGKPTWLLLPFAPDWRWMLGRADSPWYRQVRLFRQPSTGAWPAVIADVGQALRDRCPRAKGDAGISGAIVGGQTAGGTIPAEQPAG